MLKGKMKLLVFFSLIVSLSESSFSTPYHYEEVRITQVIDGDTVVAQLGEKSVRIRLAEIDAPEIGQPWGLNAKKALEAKVLGSSVTLEVIDVDRYDRLVARLILDDRQINRELVSEGHVWVYRRYMRDESLLVNETIASKNKIGLWATGSQIAPWEWRRGKRTERFKSTREVARSCDEKPYCRDLKTCEDALFFLEICHLQRLDGDQDGVPCEALCKQ